MKKEETSYHTAHTVGKDLQGKWDLQNICKQKRFRESLVGNIYKSIVNTYDAHLESLWFLVLQNVCKY